MVFLGFGATRQLRSRFAADCRDGVFGVRRHPPVTQPVRRRLSQWCFWGSAPPASLRSRFAADCRNGVFGVRRHPPAYAAGSPMSMEAHMDRFWFFTWRTFGTWLPGSEGFVGHYEGTDGRRRIDNVPGEKTTTAMPALAAYAAQSMKQEAVYLCAVQARAIFDQMQETARYRNWRIDAVAVLASHVHVVFGVPGDPSPSDLLRDWKSWTSRALNRLSRRQRWWVDGGSKRPLKSVEQWIGAIRYVRDQENSLLIWLSEGALAALATYGEPAA
jgi:REP element-mobilizing transposase RayT